MKVPLKLLSLLLICSTPALAQTHMMMPEGSKDIYISLGAYYGPRTEGSADYMLSGGPFISVQWANGIFIDMNVIGMHLSRKLNVSYGPLLTPSFSRVTIPTAEGTVSRKRFTPELGGFFNYHIAHGLSLNSNLMYGGSYDRRGLRMNVGLNGYLPVAAHHTLGLSAYVSLANRSALESNYAVSRHLAAISGLPEHEVSGGIRKTTLGASWRWEVNNKYALTTQLRREQLHGSAAASPRMEKDSAVSLVTFVTYHW